VFLVRYELGFYVPEDGILHSHSRENIKSYTVAQSHLRKYLSDHYVHILLKI
jgi:hypothetical protein